MKINAAGLTGPALDWAVAKLECDEGWLARHMHLLPTMPFSTDWAQGGPIIEREGLYLRANDNNSKWAAGALSKNRFDQTPGPLYWANTPLIAAMRCYVASKLGDEIEIPEELT